MFKQNLRLIAAAVAVAACATFPFATSAADLTVAQGNSVTLSNGDSYDAVVVNGNLTVPANAAVSAASLTVADGAYDATVTLEPGSSLTISDDVHLGYNGGQAHVNVRSGASMTVNGSFYMAYGHTSSPASGAPVTHAYLTISNATVTVIGKSKGDGFCFKHGYWPSGTSQGTDVDFVRLEEGAVLKCSRVSKTSDHDARSGCIVFNGGKILFESNQDIWQSLTLSWSARNTFLRLQSENNHPIHLTMGSCKHNAWFNFGSQGNRVTFEGAGGLVLEGRPQDNKTPDWGVPPNNCDTGNPNLEIKDSLGPIHLIGMPLINRYCANFFGESTKTTSKALIADSGTYFDMYGNDAEFKSVKGCIRNSGGNPCTLTMGRDGSDSQLTEALPAGVSLVKNGSGKLTMFAADTSNATVNGGTLEFMNRAEMGYAFYKIKFEEFGMEIGSNYRMYINEIAYLSGGQDVTRPYAALHHSKAGSSYVEDPETLVDGNLSTCYYDLRLQKPYSDPDRDLVQLTVQYTNCIPVDGYRWSPYRSGSKPYYAHNPTAWKVYGGMSTSDMTLLDQVDNFSVTDVVDGWNATNFVCRYENPAITISSLTLASGVALAADGANVTAAAATAASAVPVTLTHGATLTLPAATEVASLSVDVDAGGGTLTNFRPAANGAIYLTGNVGRLSNFVVPVSVGMLLGDNLSSWAVYVDGQLQSHIGLFVNDDHFLQTESHIPTILVVR
jgi:hypothetical protein